MKTFAGLIVLALVVCSCGSFGEGMLAALSSYGGGYSSMGSYSPVSSGGNMDYLLDPRYAMAQTAVQQAQFNQVASSIAQTTVAQVQSEEEQQYQQFCKFNKKADGSNYTKSEWRTLVGQAIQNSKSGSYSTSTTTSYGGGTNNSSTSTSRRCMKLNVSDLAHCNGDGKCARCNGKGRYYDTSFGNGRWVDPCIHCKGNGKCPTCHGTGFQ